jgi:FAD synthetase
MRVLITGCFDILHPGHIYLLKEGAKMGEVYVIVARDETIKKYKKKLPTIPENQRLEVIRAIKYVTYATLGNPNNNYLEKAISLKPDLILLGANQRISIENLKRDLQINNASHIKVSRLDSLSDKYELNSSSKIKSKIKKNM